MIFSVFGVRPRHPTLSRLAWRIARWLSFSPVLLQGRILTIAPTEHKRGREEPFVCRSQVRYVFFSLLSSPLIRVRSSLFVSSFSQWADVIDVWDCMWPSLVDLLALRLSFSLHPPMIETHWLIFYSSTISGTH